MHNQHNSTAKERKEMIPPLYKTFALSTVSYIKMRCVIGCCCENMDRKRNEDSFLHGQELQVCPRFLVQSLFFCRNCSCKLLLVVISRSTVVSIPYRNEARLAPLKGTRKSRRVPTWRGTGRGLSMSKLEKILESEKSAQRTSYLTSVRKLLSWWLGSDDRVFGDFAPKFVWDIGNRRCMSFLRAPWLLSRILKVYVDQVCGHELLEAVDIHRRPHFLW